MGRSNNRAYYQGKLAVVTGGSLGIGYALAAQLVEKACGVVLLARNQERLQEAVQSIRKRRSTENTIVKGISVDLTDYAKTTEILEQIVGDFGVPYFLFNNAGYSHPGYIDELDIEAYRQQMEVNYFATVHTCKALIPHLIKQAQGHIVNVSSMAGFLGLFGYTGYCGSKWAVVGFSEALKFELKVYKIDVSVVCPPNTKTPGLERENQLKPAEVLATEEKVKVLEADEVATSILSRLPRRPFMILPNFDGRLAYTLKRYAPSVVAQFCKRPELTA